MKKNLYHLAVIGLVLSISLDLFSKNTLIFSEVSAAEIPESIENIQLTPQPMVEIKPPLLNGIGGVPVNIPVYEKRDDRAAESMPITDGVDDEGIRQTNTLANEPQSPAHSTPSSVVTRQESTGVAPDTAVLGDHKQAESEQAVAPTLNKSTATKVGQAGMAVDSSETTPTGVIMIIGSGLVSVIFFWFIWRRRRSKKTAENAIRIGN